MVERRNQAVGSFSRHRPELTMDVYRKVIKCIDEYLWTFE